VPTWKVELIPEAQKDYNNLDGSVRKHVLKQLVKLEQNPDYGNPLGHKAGINLDGYFKLHANKKQIRIIYEIVEHIIKKQKHSSRKLLARLTPRNAGAKTNEQKSPYHRHGRLPFGRFLIGQYRLGYIRHVPLAQSFG
jgi:mRNA interferase RelE/StbE